MVHTQKLGKKLLQLFAFASAGAVLLPRHPVLCRSPTTKPRSSAPQRRPKGSNEVTKSKKQPKKGRKEGNRRRGTEGGPNQRISRNRETASTVKRCKPRAYVRQSRFDTWAEVQPAYTSDRKEREPT